MFPIILFIKSGRLLTGKLETALEVKLGKLRQLISYLYKKFEFKNPVSGVFPFSYPIHDSSDKPFFSSKVLSITTLILLSNSFVFWWVITSPEINIMPASIYLKVIYTGLTSIIIIAGLILIIGIGVALEGFSENIAVILELISVLGILLVLVLVWGILIGLFLLFGYVLPKILERFLSFIISIMEKGEETVVSFFMLWGVTLFIIGNLLQFLATFFEVKK